MPNSEARRRHRLPQGLAPSNKRPASTGSPALKDSSLAGLDCSSVKGCPGRPGSSQTQHHRHRPSPYETVRGKSGTDHPCAAGSFRQRARKRNRAGLEIPVRWMLPWCLESKDFAERTASTTAESSPTISRTCGGEGRPGSSARGETRGGGRGPPGAQDSKKARDEEGSPGRPESRGSSTDENGDARPPLASFFQTPPPHLPAVDDYIRSPSLTFEAIAKRGHTEALPVGGHGVHLGVETTKDRWAPPDGPGLESAADSDHLLFSDEDIEEVRVVDGTMRRSRGLREAPRRRAGGLAPRVP